MTRCNWGLGIRGVVSKVISPLERFLSSCVLGGRATLTSMSLKLVSGHRCLQIHARDPSHK